MDFNNAEREVLGCINEVDEHPLATLGNISRKTDLPVVVIRSVIRNLTLLGLVDRAFGVGLGSGYVLTNKGVEFKEASHV